MATTSLTLGGHWEKFIKQEIKNGQYSTASEVVRYALRELEDRGKRLEAMRAHLAEGAGQAARKDFIEGFDINAVIERAKSRA